METRMPVYLQQILRRGFINKDAQTVRADIQLTLSSLATIEAQSRKNKTIHLDPRASHPFNTLKRTPVLNSFDIQLPKQPCNPQTEVYERNSNLVPSPVREITSTLGLEPSKSLNRLQITESERELSDLKGSLTSSKFRTKIRSIPCEHTKVVNSKRIVFKPVNLVAQQTLDQEPLRIYEPSRSVTLSLEKSKTRGKRFNMQRQVAVQVDTVNRAVYNALEPYLGTRQVQAIQKKRQDRTKVEISNIIRKKCPANEADRERRGKGDDMGIKICAWEVVGLDGA